jgi:hypothetical protein
MTWEPLVTAARWRRQGSGWLLQEAATDTARSLESPSLPTDAADPLSRGDPI